MVKSAIKVWYIPSWVGLYNVGFTFRTIRRYFSIHDDLIRNLAILIIGQSFAYITHDAVVMKVVVTGSLPHMLVRLWLYQLVLAYAAIYRHELFLVNGRALATIRLDV